MSSFIDLLKGRTQKYIKRIPKAGGGYRYVYKEHHKGGVGAQEHMKEGAAFKLTFGGQEGHFHIVKAQGDKITVKHDELHGPDHKGVEMTKAELSELLTREHKPALEADAKKKRERVERMKRETPRHIGLKRAERLAKEAEARLGEERPDNFETMPEGEALAQEIKRLETALEEQPPAEDARATPKNAPYQHLSPTQRLAIDRGYLLRPQTEEERALLAELKYVREHQTDPSPALRNLIFEEYSRAFPDFGGKTAFSQIFEQGMSYEPYTLKHTQASRTDIDEKKLTSHIRDKLRYHGAANRAGSAAVTYIDQMRKVELYAADALEFSSTDKQRAAVNELVQQARQKALKYIDDFSEGRPLSRARADLSKLEENIKKDLDITRKLRALRDKHIKETKRALTKLKTAEKKQPTTPTPAPDNFETMPEGERIANKAREAIERVKAHINELRDQQSMGLSEDEALEIDEQILDAQLTLRKLEREELKARRAAAKEQAPKAQPIEPPKPEPVKVEPAPAPEPAPAQEEAPEMVAFVEQALRDSIGKMRPARIIQRGEKITNPATYDNIETRYFFAVASAKLGRQFVDLGSRLDTPETRQAITDIYRATHTKGANAEQAKAQAYPLILEQIINTLEGFDLKTWFQTDPESLAKIERRIETLKQLKAKAQTPREATAPAPEPVQEQQPAPDNFETMPKDEFLEHPQVKGIIGGERGEVFRALNAAPREITVRLHQIVLDNYKEHKTTGFPEDTTVAILQAYKHPEEMAAKDKKLKERQAALTGLDERLPLAGIKASDLSLADAQASYRGVSWSGKERGEQELLEFKDILDRLEETGRQYIEAGAHEGDVSSVISYHAQKILDAKRAQIAARGRTMSAMITGRGNFPVRSQKKKMDTYDKRLSEFVAAVDKAKKQLKKLDPNSRHAQRIEQGSGVDAYQAKLDKLVALQAEYKKLRAKARKEGKEPELVIPQYLLTNNNNQIRRVREQIENEKQREQQLDTADKLKDYTMPDGNELQVDRDQKDNRLKLHFWDKPDKDTIAKLKRSGYKWSRYNEAWQRQLTTNALKELPSLLNNLGAVEAIEEADA